MGVVEDCWQHRSLPGLAPGGGHLDVYRAAVGRKHAALVTATGAVYCWGEGRGGKLGLGHDQDQAQPLRIRHGLQGQCAVAVACGDDCTAALTDGGELFMWGRLHVDSRPQLVPLQVRGDLRGRKVVQVRWAGGRGWHPCGLGGQQRQQRQPPGALPLAPSLHVGAASVAPAAPAGRGLRSCTILRVCLVWCGAHPPACLPTYRPTYLPTACLRACLPARRSPAAPSTAPPSPPTASCSRGGRALGASWGTATRPTARTPR